MSPKKLALIIIIPMVLSMSLIVGCALLFINHCTLKCEEKYKIKLEKPEITVTNSHKIMIIYSENERLVSLYRYSFSLYPFGEIRKWVNINDNLVAVDK